MQTAPKWIGAASSLRDAGGTDPKDFELLASGLEITNTSENLYVQRARWLSRRHNLTLPAAAAIAALVFDVAEVR